MAADFVAFVPLLATATNSLNRTPLAVEARYRHRARVSDVILLALLGFQGAGWQKQCAESLCCGVLRCCCKVVSRTGEGISRASHESWRSLGWCGGAVSVCMWHFPRWSVRQCVASWASRASHGCISFCLGLALGACLSHLALPVYAYLACAGLLAQLWTSLGASASAKPQSLCEIECCWVAAPAPELKYDMEKC